MGINYKHRREITKRDIRRTANQHLPIAGIHSVAALLDEHYESVVKLWVGQSQNNHRIKLLVQAAKEQSISVEEVKANRLDQLAIAHQGVIAWCRPPVWHNFAWLVENISVLPRLLVLDRITDSYNLGACLRTAEAAGVNALLLPRNKSASVSVGTAKAASGALFRVPIIKVSLSQALDHLSQSGYTIVGLSEHEGTSIFDINPKEPIIIALGSEHTGLSPSIKSHCTHLVSIPTKGSNSSLNISVATGIALFSLLDK